MQRVAWTLGLALGLLLISGNSQAGDASKEFFNGKDLAGWEGLIDQFWSVKDGAIVGHSAEPIKFNTFLCSKKQYADFELTFQVKMTKGANSGVQIRSKIENPKTFQNAGPQCDMGQQYWGSLYGEHFGGMMKAADPKLVKEVVKEGDWNDYAIKAVGKRVTIQLNGKTTVDGEFEKMPPTGIISWQLHSGGPMDVTFRNIRFKDLSEKK